MPATLTNEDGAGLNGPIRAQNDHLRGSQLKLAALSQLRIVHPDLYGLFFEILAPVFGFHDVSRPAILDHPKAEWFLWRACSSVDQLLQVAAPA